MFIIDTCIISAFLLSRKGSKSHSIIYLLFDTMKSKNYTHQDVCLLLVCHCGVEVFSFSWMNLYKMITSSKKTHGNDYGHSAVSRSPKDWYICNLCEALTIVNCIRWPVVLKHRERESSQSQSKVRLVIHKNYRPSVILWLEYFSNDPDIHVVMTLEHSGKVLQLHVASCRGIAGMLL
jgi:hypothetical protein